MMTPAITPAEASDFITWAMKHNALDDKAIVAMTAFVAARREAFETVIEYASKHLEELRGMENGCTPAESDKKEILRHKGDKMSNVVSCLQELQENPTL